MGIRCDGNGHYAVVVTKMELIRAMAYLILALKKITRLMGLFSGEKNHWSEHAPIYCSR